MSIFKAYDIRGLVPEELDEEKSYRIGRALAVFLEAERVVVGHDMRGSSEALRSALVKGLTENGCDVTKIGLSTTSMSYFAGVAGGYDGSVMITASHNPGHYNGLKICREMAIPVSGVTGLAEIEKLVESPLPGGSGRGRVEERDYREPYLRQLLSFAGKGRKLKVVMDCGNGMGGLLAADVAERLDLEAIPMYWELDGSFPHHEANPLVPENTADLQQRVRETGADLGVAFDGDADRVMFVDETGERISADLMTALIASDLLKGCPGAKILYDLRSSRVVPEVIRASGGEAICSRVGHAFIKSQMRQVNSAFAGELSGHYYFRANHFIDCGFFALIQVVNLLRTKGKPVSELMLPLRKYFSTGEINSKVSSVSVVLARLEARYSGAAISHLDGLSVEYDDWWFNVRPSNTEPLLRLNLEAASLEEMERRRDELLAAIRGVDP